MQSAPLPTNEPERLAALRAHGVLDTPPEVGFDDLTALASHVCGCPIALVSLVDGERQWFKSHHGLAVRETPRDVAFCAHAILGADLFVVPDAEKDERFHDNPLTSGFPHVRFYAGAPLVDSDGFALGTLCVIDHEPRALTPAQLDALRRLGRQAVAQLELRRATAEALSHARAKTEFLATMSHEIRTPLNGVVATTRLLAETPLTPAQLELARVAQSSGEHLLHVVSGVLDFSRLEAKQVELEALPFDVGELAGQVGVMLGHEAKQKGLALHVDVDTGLAGPRRLGDPTRLRQVLVNLVANGVKFTNAGSVRLGIVPSGRGAVRFEVTDTGVGIAPEVLPRLFQRFAQAEAATTRRYGGTGLGLAISRALVSLMGGELRVASTPGAGTTFSFEVPLPEAAPEAPPRLPASHAASTEGLAVLVAEDNAVNQIVIRRILERLGCADVSVVGDGAAAVRAANERAWDVILMDCEMPTMDGIAATTTIRGEPGPSQSAPVIALTAGGAAGDRARCEAAGMNAFLTKPVLPETLREAIARVRAG